MSMTLVFHATLYGLFILVCQRIGAPGRTAEAREVLKELSRCNHVGLFSEDIDPATHEHWGNYPQTYSMVGVISSALRLSRPWEEVV